MGDWQDGYDAGLWGEDGIPYGIDDPCWNDDWEHDLRSSGIRTVEEWNAIGRVVVKGEKGFYLPCARILIFRESQTILSKFNNGSEFDTDEKYYFETYLEAKLWAKENPGVAITRSPTGKGFIKK